LTVDGTESVQAIMTGHNDPVAALRERAQVFGTAIAGMINFMNEW
jgi:hypothetical protein